MKRHNKDSVLQARLDAISHTRPRAPMPRPQVFKDGRPTSKQRRREGKEAVREYERDI